MRYVVTTTPTFRTWFDEQDRDLQRAISIYVGLLEAHGPTLGRPYADTLKASRVSNLKELRVQFRGQPYRILFAFDTRRQAVLLLGGRKTGNRRWYRRMIAVAEKLYAGHLEALPDKEDEEDDERAI